MSNDSQEHRSFLTQTISASAIIVLSFPLTLAGDAKPPTISAEQFAIAGVSLGVNKVTELIRTFGEPAEVRSEETEAGPDTAKTYVFEGVEAYTQDGELLNLACTNPAYMTPDGAKVGDSLDTIFRIYGRTKVEERGDARLIRYNVAETDANLLIHINDERVSRIELWLDYT
jgi:hypothetical protein